MKTLDTFYDLLMPQLPGISTPMLDLHLVELARDFCERSRAWRGDFDPVDTVASQAAYDLSPSESQSEPVAIHKLTVNGELLFDDTWDFDNPPPRALPCPAIRPAYTRYEPPFAMSNDHAQIVLIDAEVPTDSVAGGLVITGSMKPKRGATALPDLLMATHLETLTSGVLARLGSMAGKPWTSGNAGAWRMEYERGVQNAATQAQHNYTRVLLRATPWG